MTNQRDAVEVSDRPQSTGIICAVCTAEVAAWPNAMVCHCHEMPWSGGHRLAAEAAMQARMEEMEAALRPFAEAARVNDGDTISRLRRDETTLWTGTGSWQQAAPVTMGDLRAARAALCKTDPTDGGMRDGH